MDLVRNTTKDGSCKYALIRLDKMHNSGSFKNIEEFLRSYPELKDYIEFGEPNSEEEFFVIKLKDINSTRALANYALEADKTDSEFSVQVLDLALRSGKHHISCKIPDTYIKDKFYKPSFPKSELRSETYDPLKPNVPIPPPPAEINKPEPQYSIEDFSTPLPNKSGFDGKDVGFFKSMWMDFKSLFK